MDGGTDTTARSRDALHPRDERVRVAAFAFRIAAAAAVVAASPLSNGPAGDGLLTFALVIALAWVPAAGVAESLRRRGGGRLADRVTLVLDVAFLFFTLVMFESVTAFVLAAQLLVVGYYTYVGGLALGLVAAAASMAVTAGAGEFTEPSERAAVVALSPLAFGGMVLLMRRLAIHHLEAAAHIAHLHDKATAIATGIAEAVVVTSPRGRVLEWNAAADTSFGCPADEALDRNCAEVLGLRRELEELDCSEGCALLRARLDEDDEGDSGGGFRVWRRRPGPSDARQALLAHVAPLVDDHGQVFEVVHSFRDVSKLVEADEAKTVFLATATHELKTPLTVIMGFAELLSRRSDLADEERDQALHAIQDRTRQLSDIVDRILLSSRIEAGQVDLEVVPLGIGDLIEDRALVTLAATARSPVLRIPDTLPLALADEDAVATVLDHLLDNALKYSDSESPVVVGVDHDDSSVVLWVRDEGIGMTADEAKHCFDRFWQAESGDVRRFGGTGIGLYIVKSLVDAMRGSVSVESAPGKGTTFAVRFEAATSAGVEAPRSPAEGAPSLIAEFMRQVGVPGRVEG